MGRRLKFKEPKVKIPRLTIVPREPEKGKDPDKLAVEAYEMLDDIVERFHIRLDGAVILIAWLRGLKANTDDQLLLGKAIKAADIPRQLGKVDWIIALNRDAFGMFSPQQRRALIDHELCHAAVAVNSKTGEDKTDAHGRKVYRVRKHDIEEFREIVKRHGLWKDDLQAFWQSIVESDKAPLFSGGAGKADKKPKAAKAG